MQDCATSTDSLSSAVSVPSLREFERKSMMASARRFFEAWESCDDLLSSQSFRKDLLKAYHLEANVRDLKLCLRS